MKDVFKTILIIAAWTAVCAIACEYVGRAAVYVNEYEKNMLDAGYVRCYVVPGESDHHWSTPENCI